MSPASSPAISIGRIVHYTLSANDAEQIMRRRTSSTAIAVRVLSDKWPIGAQAHIGNSHGEGQVVPLIVTRIWSDEYGPGIPGVNGQALLDGNDVLWITSAAEGEGPGKWQWPPRV